MHTLIRKGERCYDGVGEVTRVLKWHHFLPSQDPLGERRWGFMWLSLSQTPFFCLGLGCDEWTVAPSQEVP